MQHAALDGCADGDGLVRIDVAARFLAKEFFDLFLYFGHACLPADEDHVVDVGYLEAGVLEGGAAWINRAFDQAVNQRFKLGARDFQRQMFRAGSVGRNVRQVDFGLLAGRQLDFGFFRRILEALQRQYVGLQINAGFLLEFLNDVVDQALVKVFAAEEGVAVGREDFKLLFALDVSDFDDRNIEGAAAEVIDGDFLVALFLVHAESKRGRGRFVDDALDLQPGNAAGVFGCLTLAIVEVGGDGDDGFGHFFAEIIFGRLFHLAQHFGGNLRWRDFLIAHFHPGIAIVGLDDFERHQTDIFLDFLFLEAAPDQAFDREQRILGVRDRLPFGWRANENFAIFSVGDDGRRRACAFRIFNYLRCAAFHDGDATIGGAEVDADGLSHISILYKTQ